MTHCLIVADWLLPMLYLALLIEYGAAFFLRTQRRGPHWLLPAFCGLHAALLVLLAVYLERPVPANNYEVLSVLALATTAVYWAVEYASGERRTGVFVLLAAFLMQYTASVFLPFSLEAELPGGQAGTTAGLHLIPSMLAYTALTISAIYGLFHLVARRDLKRHRFGLLFDRLPSLELLGTMNWHAMLTGLVFLTLAIASGATAYVFGPREPLSTKVWMKMLTGGAAWGVCAAAALGRWKGGWSVPRVCLASLAGFLAVLVMLVASIVLS